MVLPIVAAIAGSTIVGALSARSAARAQSRGAKDAADAQLTATRESNALAERFRREDLARFQPFYGAGINALEDYWRGMNEGFNFDFQTDPGYQFRLNEGLDAVNSSASARHGMNSGAAMKALNRYGQDYASNEYGNVFARQYGMWNDRLNRLGQLAASGQNAAGMQASASQNYGGQMGQNITAGGQAAAQGIANAANARAAGTVGMANALTGGINNAIGAWQFQNLSNAFMQPQQTGGAPMTSPRPMANPFLPRA